MDRNLMHSGTGWSAFINKTILQLIDVNPEVDMVRYRVENNELIISKSPNKRLDADQIK